MSRKIKPEKLIPIYRNLILEEARLRLAYFFRPYLAFLLINEDGQSRLVTEECDTGSTDAAKDAFVEQVREDARACGAIAVWCACRGYIAPDEGPRPSKHPEGKKCVFLFESSILGERYWQALIRKQGRYHDDLGRWYNQGSPGNGRFVNLVGGGPRLVKEES